MKPTTITRRTHWFLTRALARAYREMLGMRPWGPGSKDAKPATKRSLHAEALEPRVLFSGSPMPVDPNFEGGDGNDAAAQVAEVLDSIVDTDATVDGIPGASFAKYGFGDGDLEEKEVARLAQVTLARWEVSGLTEEQLAALEEMEAVVDGLGENTDGYLDDETALRLLVDDPESIDGEFVEIEGLMQEETIGEDESSGDGGEGLDFSSADAEEQGIPNGLPEEIDNLIGFVDGLFVES